MKLRDKFNILKDAAFVKQMVVTSVYGTMQLEEQEVSRSKIERLYDKVQEDKEISNSERK